MTKQDFQIQTTIGIEMEINLQIQSINADLDADPEFDVTMKLYDPNGELC